MVRPGLAAAAAGQTGDEFMRDLVAAMRKVADEARDTGVADLRTKADEQVRLLESDAERRREELRERAEKDVTEVGEWEKAEAERIKKEAEQRVVARRAQLDQQLATDTTRTEAETKAVRERVAEYERELDAYHSQLIEINDPAAFAAAAKRMPKAPSLDGGPAATTDIPAPSPARGAPPVAAAAPASADDQVPVEPITSASNGVPEPAPEVHPAEEEVLAARLAELDATLPQTADAPAAKAAPTGARAGHDRGRRQGPRELRGDHRLPAGALRRRGHRCRRAQPWTDRRVRVPRHPCRRIRRPQRDRAARGRRGEDRGSTRGRPARHP